jgi:heptosyltransferase II
MGDVLLCTPAIRAARATMPDAIIDFVTEGAGGEVLRHNPHLDEVLVDDRRFGSRLRLMREIARRRYDAVVDFRSTGSTAQLTLVSRAGLRVGVRGRGPRNRVYNRLVDRIELTTYAARHKLDMLEPLGVPVYEVTDLALELPVSPAAHSRAEAIWREHRLLGETVVAISPISREAYKQWGSDRWAAVADLVAEQGARVILTSGPGERAALAEVAGRMRSTPVWDYGPTTIEELAAVLTRCSLWAGNDGGSKHVAAAAGIPTVSVVRWQIGPVWTDPTAAAPQRFLDREPPGGCDLRCGRCTHRGCLAAISSAEVVERVTDALRGVVDVDRQRVNQQND